LLAAGPYRVRVDFSDGHRLEVEASVPDKGYHLQTVTRD
jgi:hypothetical protein